MLNLFRALSRRLQALFATHIALDFEQQFLIHQSDRKAELLRKAQDLEEEGQSELAEELREQAKDLSLQRPLASVLPATEELQTGVESNGNQTAIKQSPNSKPKRITKRGKQKAK